MLPKFIIDNAKTEAEAFFLTAATADRRGEEGAREAAIDALATILNFEGIGEHLDDANLELVAAEAYGLANGDLDAAIDYAVEEADAR